MMNTIKKYWLIILVIIIALLLALFILFTMRTSWMWCTKGTIFQNTLPAVGGDMVVDNNQLIYIFDSRAHAMTEFKPFEPPPLEELDNFRPEYTEEWMKDAGERLNRDTVRLFKTAVNAEPSLLFREYGQNGYWWISEDTQTIYILVEWCDYTKQPIEPAHLSFWKSVNGGKDFSKIKWANPYWGRGQSIGMYFDSQGINGYIFVNQNTLLQTRDAGETWHKVYIPHTEAKQLPSKEIAIDTATVDSQGNLLFSLFKDGNSYIYQIPATNKEKDLSQIQAKYQIPNRRLLSINSVPEQPGLYLFYINCQGANCTWFDSLAEERGNKNQPLRFTYFIEGKYNNDQSLGFFLPIKQVYLDKQGKIAVTTTMANKPDYNLLLSKDYGKTWLVEDLSETIVISDYIDLKNNQYWQNRRFNKVYMAEGLFK